MFIIRHLGPGCCHFIVVVVVTHFNYRNTR